MKNNSAEEYTGEVLASNAQSDVDSRNSNFLAIDRLRLNKRVSIRFSARHSSSSFYSE